MKWKALLAGAVVLALASMPLASYRAQAPTPGDSDISPPLKAATPAPTAPPAPVPPKAAARCVPPSAPAAKDMTVEQLLTRLAEIKAKREELAKQEKELVEVLKKKLTEQKERLQKLGVAADGLSRFPDRAPGSSLRSSWSE
jgi:hypothetical protein